MVGAIAAPLQNQQRVEFETVFTPTVDDGVDLGREVGHVQSNGNHVGDFRERRDLRARVFADG